MNIEKEIEAISAHFVEWNQNVSGGDRADKGFVEWTWGFVDWSSNGRVTTYKDLKTPRLGSILDEVIYSVKQGTSQGGTCSYAAALEWMVRHMDDLIEALEVSMRESPPWNREEQREMNQKEVENLINSFQ